LASSKVEKQPDIIENQNFLSRNPTKRLPPPVGIGKVEISLCGQLPLTAQRHFYAAARLSRSV
jgi:hypothetical protein